MHSAIGADAADPGAMNRRQRSRLPRIPVRILLKSWAIPPAMVPTASIFCISINCLSSRRRSVTSIPVTITETTDPASSVSGAWFQAIVRRSPWADTTAVSRGGGVRPAATPWMAPRWRSRAGSATSRSHIFLPSASRAAIPVTSSHWRLKSWISPARFTWRTSAPEMSSIRFEKSRSFRIPEDRALSPTSQDDHPQGPRRCGTKRVDPAFPRRQVRRSPRKDDPSMRRTRLPPTRFATRLFRSPAVRPEAATSRGRPGCETGSARRTDGPDTSTQHLRCGFRSHHPPLAHEDPPRPAGSRATRHRMPRVTRGTHAPRPVDHLPTQRAVADRSASAYSNTADAPVNDETLCASPAGRSGPRRSGQPWRPLASANPCEHFLAPSSAAMIARPSARRSRAVPARRRVVPSRSHPEIPRRSPRCPRHGSSRREPPSDPGEEVSVSAREDCAAGDEDSPLLQDAHQERSTSTIRSTAPRRYLKQNHWPVSRNPEARSREMKKSPRSRPVNR